MEDPVIDPDTEITDDSENEDPGTDVPESPFEFRNIEIENVDFSAKGYKYLTGIREIKHYDTAEEFYGRVTASITGTLEDLGLSQDAFNTIANAVYAKDLYDMTSSVFVNSENGAKGRFEEYLFEYNAVSASGNPITLTGVAVFLNYQTNGVFMHTLDGISLVHDHLKSYDDCVSIIGSIDYLRAIYNQLVVMSDFEGYNHNEERTVHPYVSYNELAHQSIDCALAALELLDYVGVCMKEGYKTYNMGMSKGAGVAMATHKLLENSVSSDISSKFPLAGTYCATGLYDFRGMIEYYNDKKVKGESTSEEDLKISWMAATAFYFAYSSHQSVISEAEFKNLFTTEFVDFSSSNKLFGNPDISWGGFQDILSEGGFVSLDKVLNARFFIQEGWNKGAINEEDELVKKIFDILDEENPAYGWVPKASLLMEHSKDDELSNYEVSVSNYLELKHQGMIPNLYVDFNTYYDLDHNTMSGVGLVRMAVLKDPFKPIIFNLF